MSGFNSESKVGALLEVGALLLILITSLGVYKVISESQHIYIGDSSTGMFYDYKICPEEVKKIPEEKSILFDNVEEAKSMLKATEGCVEE